MKAMLARLLESPIIFYIIHFKRLYLKFEFYDLNISWSTATHQFRAILPGFESRPWRFFSPHHTIFRRQILVCFVACFFFLLSPYLFLFLLFSFLFFPSYFSYFLFTISSFLFLFSTILFSFMHSSLSYFLFSFFFLFLSLLCPSFAPSLFLLSAISYFDFPSLILCSFLLLFSATVFLLCPHLLLILFSLFPYYLYFCFSFL